jgi:hypothetical protein
LAESIWPDLSSVDHDQLCTRLDRLAPKTFPAAAAVCCLTIAESISPELIGVTDFAIQGIRHLTKAWKLSTDEERSIRSAIQHGQFIATCENVRWSELQPRLMDRDIVSTLSVAESVFGSIAGVERAKRELQRPMNTLNPEPWLTGDDLIAMGHRPSPDFKRWLQEARRLQLDGEVDSQDAIIDRLKLDRHKI